MSTNLYIDTLNKQMKNKLFPPFLLFLIFSCEQHENKITEKSSVPNETKLEANKAALVDSTTQKKTNKLSKSIIAERKGKVEWLIPVDSDVKIGTCIARINNDELFQALSRKKIELKKQLDIQLGEFPAELNSRKEIWEGYLREIDVKTILPALPLDFKEEYDWLKSSEIIQLQEEIIQAEIKMKDYFILAKTSGKITAWKIKKGSQINVNQLIGEIEK